MIEDEIAMDLSTKTCHWSWMVWTQLQDFEFYFGQCLNIYQCIVSWKIFYLSFLQFCFQMACLFLSFVFKWLFITFHYFVTLLISLVGNWFLFKIFVKFSKSLSELFHVFWFCNTNPTKFLFILFIYLFIYLFIFLVFKTNFIFRRCKTKNVC